MTSTLSKLFFTMAWKYGCSIVTSNCIEKWKPLITSFVNNWDTYVLVALDDVDLRPFQPRVLRTCRKRNDISKLQLRLYQQLQLIHVLIPSSMRLLNVQPCDYLPLRDNKVEDLWYLSCNSIQTQRFGSNYLCRATDFT